MTMRRLGFSLGPLALVLPLTFACSGSSGDGEGGGSSTPAGSTMGELAELGDKYVGANQATYDGVGFLAESLQSSLASGLPAAAFSAKQGDGCLPDGLAGVTHEFDAPSGMFVAGDIPGAPVDAARFNLYETNGGVPSSNVIGTLDVSCTGQFPSGANLRLLVSADGTELLDLRMTNASFSPQFFSSQLDGSLNSPDGDSLAFGAFGFEGGSYISEDVMFGGGETLNFDLGDVAPNHPKSFAADRALHHLNPPRSKFHKVL